MNFHGDINLQQNKIHKLVFEQELVIPDNPKPGRILFKNHKLYICVAINASSTPVWIPLTNRISTYIHDQIATLNVWTVVHDLHTTSPVVQVYNSLNEMIIPDNVEVISNREIKITMGTQIAGRAVVLFNNIMPESGIGIL